MRQRAGDGKRDRQTNIQRERDRDRQILRDKGPLDARLSVKIYQY